VIHQDLKLENILIGDQMQIKLCDFGLCNIIQGGKAVMECKVGTPGYQAPEIANGAIVTPAIDMWSYGILLHELAVG